MTGVPRISIDLNTKILTDDVRVWVLFPGKGYRFFTHLIRSGLAYADLPALPLKDFDFLEDHPLKEHLSISEKIRSHHNRRRGSDDYPSKNIADYKNYSWTGARINTKGIVRGLFSRAKKGDLVLVTSPNGVWGQTYIGEFIDEPNGIIYVELPWYPGEDTPARRVRWLNQIDNIRFSQDTIKQLTSPNAFSLLGRSRYNQIFSSAYENFIRIGSDSSVNPTGTNSFFDIRSENFTTVADLYLKIVANFGADIAKATAGDHLHTLAQGSLTDWILNLEQHEFIPSQVISINSPGRNILYSSSLSPIFAAVLFAVCQFSASEIANAELSFVNSANGDGALAECDIPVADGMQGAFDAMSLDKLEQLCVAAQKARALGSIDTPIRAVKE